MDDDNEYHDLFPQDEDSERLQHIDLIRRMATVAIETLQEPQWDKEVHDHARQMIVYAAHAYQKQIPDFKDKFPSVCVLSFISIPLHVARRAMVAACRCLLWQERAFLNFTHFLTQIGISNHSRVPLSPTALISP